MPRTRTQTLASVGKFATGSYTGDGAATQAIVGVGFQPKIVVIYDRRDIGSNPSMKGTADGLNAGLGYWLATAFIWDLDQIISLDADGFTVGDGSGGIGAGNCLNVNLVDYTYVAFG